MKGNGFRHLRNAISVTYMSPVYEEVTSDIRGKYDDILDQIFCVDPITGFPSNLLGCYLNENTSREIVQFIDTKLLRDVPQDTSIPADLFKEYEKLDPEFLTNVSPNRFESVQEYEQRLKSYFDEIENDKQFKSNLAQLKKKLNLE